MFALWDPVEEKFSGECCECHNHACLECKGIVDVLKAIEDTLRNGDLASSEKQKERARWDLDHTVSSDVAESVDTFSCVKPPFIATFNTIEEADEHMDTGHHIMTPENETIYDNLHRQWAAVTTSVKLTGQKIGRTLSAICSSC